MHVVFLVHGLFGISTHMKSMQESLEEMAREPGSDLCVCRARSVALRRSFDGLEENAKRLYVELLAQIAESNATHLSLVGYSMGGLCVRLLAGLLYQNRVFEQVRPAVFATFATPHLGARSLGSAAGFFYNLFVPYLVGPSGFDMFRKTEVIAALADPERVYYRALEQFPHLYLFANGADDHAVDFWTSFIANKDPFKGCDPASICTFASLPMFVDLKSSVFTPVGRREVITIRYCGLALVSWILMPWFYVVAFLVLTATSGYSWLKYALGPASESQDEEHHHRAGKDVFSVLQTALDASLVEEVRALDDSESENHTYGNVSSAISPGYRGFLNSCPNALPLSRNIVDEIETLNKLPWKKFVLYLPKSNAHCRIIDRANDSKTGKAVMNFFAQKVVSAVQSPTALVVHTSDSVQGVCKSSEANSVMIPTVESEARAAVIEDNRH